MPVTHNCTFSSTMVIIGRARGHFTDKRLDKPFIMMLKAWPYLRSPLAWNVQIVQHRDEFVFGLCILAVLIQNYRVGVQYIYTFKYVANFLFPFFPFSCPIYIVHVQTIWLLFLNYSQNLLSMITLFLKCPKSNELKYSLKALLCGKSTLSESILNFYGF